GARIRLHHRSKLGAAGPDAGEVEDGYLRFLCPCGRRLKVREESGLEAGKCPDCGRIVPVADSARATPSPVEDSVRGDPNARTDEMDGDDLAQLEEWAAQRSGSGSPNGGGGNATTALVATASGTDFGQVAPGSPSSMVKFEAGLRVCPRCGKPVHLSATTCRECGSPVPRR